MTTKNQSFASAVIYVHNAERTIEDFLKVVIHVMENGFEHSEIICVNDASDDQSLQLIRKASEEASVTSVSVINMSSFHGLEMSMNAGVDAAIGDFIFEFDNTELNYDPAVIMETFDRVLEGNDIVSASADKGERLSSSLFYRVFERYSDLPQKLSTESFRIVSRRAINRIDSMNAIIPYRKAVYANCGLKTDNIRFQEKACPAQGSDGKQRRYRFRLAADSLILFTEFGYSFSKHMTVLMMCTAIFMIIYSIAVYAAAKPVEGWTTTILFLSVSFFGLFLILTIVIKYLQLLVDLLFKRKRYSFDSIEKLTK